jgi:hypothetical protein
MGASYKERLNQYKDKKHDPYQDKRAHPKSKKNKPYKIYGKFDFTNNFSDCKLFCIGKYASLRDANKAIHSFSRSRLYSDLEIRYEE